MLVGTEATSSKTLQSNWKKPFLAEECRTKDVGGGRDIFLNSFGFEPQLVLKLFLSKNGST